MEKSGYLLKLGGQKNNKWQKRHFRMTFSKDAKCYMLQYKAADKDKTLKGSIFMPWTQVEEVTISLELCEFVYYSLILLCI